MAGVAYRRRPVYRKISHPANPSLPRFKGAPDLSDIEHGAAYLDPRQRLLPLRGEPIPVQLPNKARRQNG
jgi:hypothetical protein